MSQVTDMTRGKPLKLLASFALPLMLGNIFQQFYNLVDSVVVGRLIGIDAFAAVGAAGFLSWIVIDIILGFTQGFGILYAQRFGAGDSAGLRRAAAMSVFCTAVLGLLLTAGGLFSVHPVLAAIGTPAEILPATELYLYWMFSGTLITAAYNTVASLLRSLGNSKTPLLAMLLSTAVNIVLDLLFVAGLHTGVEGVAIATVLAQLCAFLFCLEKLRRVEALKLSKTDFRADGATIKELLRLGTPLAFRNAVISLGGLVIQSVINSYGKLFVAGTTAAKKYFDFTQIIVGALDGAFATYSAQNYGKHDFARIRAGMNCALRIALSSAVVIAGIVLLFGRSMVGLLVSGTPEEIAAVTEIGYQHLTAISLCLPPLCLLYLYRSGIQGMGGTLTPMLSGFLELALRIVSVLLLPLLIGQWGVYFADGLGWIGAFLLLMLSYYSTFRKKQAAYGQRSLANQET